MIVGCEFWCVFGACGLGACEFVMLVFRCLVLL